jgi:hypothetical protein
MCVAVLVVMGGQAIASTHEHVLAVDPSLHGCLPHA